MATSSTKEVRATVKRKPPAAGKGRPKGATNKLTRDVKAMILTALDGAGGAAYLQERAEDPRTASAFLTLVGKVLPLQVVGGDESSDPIKHRFTLEFVDAGSVSKQA